MKEGSRDPGRDAALSFEFCGLDRYRKPFDDGGVFGPTLLDEPFKLQTGKKG